jgi:hypothetical protein
LDDLTIAYFTPLRVRDPIAQVEDLDDAKIRYHIESCHLDCLSTRAWTRLFIYDSDTDVTVEDTPFQDGVYFHPNFAQDGWDAFRGLCDTYNTISPGTPICPPTPKFWVHGTCGSVVNRWPPSFFSQFIKVIADGGTLSLDPTDPNSRPIVLKLPCIPPPSNQIHDLDWDYPMSPLTDFASSPISPPVPTLNSNSHGDWRMPTSPMSPGEIMRFKEELAVSPSLDFLPFSTQRGPALGGLDLDGFELRTFDQASPPAIDDRASSPLADERVSDRLHTPPGSPMQEDKVKDAHPPTGRDDDSYLWEQVGPMPDVDMAGV